MHSHASGAMIMEGRECRSLMYQESGSREIGRSCQNIMVYFTLLIALALIVPVIMSWTTNVYIIPPHKGILMIVGIPLLVLGICLYYYLRLIRETREGDANQTSFQVPNAANTVLTLPVEDHTEPNDHRDRPQRQQLTTRTASSDPHHYVVVADHPNSPTQAGPDVSSPHDFLPSYEMVMKYSNLFKVPQPPSS